jgi:protein-tyrosine phosphatase
MPRTKRHRILFVCMGNICRSPTAEAVFRHVVSQEAPDLDVEIDSAGTHAYHVGEPPDDRAIAAARRRGVGMSALRARVVQFEDFERYDLLLAMDRQNRSYLLSMAPRERHERVRLLLDYAPHVGRAEVPDPYYGGEQGFEDVLDLVEEASRGLIAALRSSR